MSTAFLLFAWVPLAMAFMSHGAGGSIYVLLSLLLLCVGYEVCAATFRYHAQMSEFVIGVGYNVQAFRAWRDGDSRGSAEALRAQQLFDMRGAA